MDSAELIDMMAAMLHHRKSLMLLKVYFMQKQLLM
tara:strand:+ start:260 stop:364 length:105 start_codon:yes stop_codon:yes gene_type:complete